MSKRKLIVEVELGDATDAECGGCPWQQDVKLDALRAPLRICTNHALHSAKFGFATMGVGLPTPARVLTSRAASFGFDEGACSADRDRPYPRRRSRTQRGLRPHA